MIWNSQPYNFELAKKALNDFFIKLIEKESDFNLQDIEEEFKTGKLSFNENSQICYTDIHGEVRPVYLFMYKPNWGFFKGKPSVSFHPFKCQKIQEELSGNDLVRYRRTETNIVDLKPIREHKDYKNVEINMCGSCSRMLSEIVDEISVEFKNELSTHNITDEKNIYGYSMEWRRLSREYRQKQNYKCEKCGTQVVKNEDKKYIHTHHIDGNKSNNEVSNLKCLCIVCHSFVDDNHKRRFIDGGSNERNRQEFIGKYRSQLEDY